MTRPLMVVGSLLLVGSCLAQDWTQQGSITSRQYQNQIREGNTIVATDFFTLEYSVETWIEDTGLRAGPHMTCDNKCKGLVHADHTKCDISCDVKCTERHSVTVRGTYTPDRGAMAGATRDANALAINAGGSTAPDDWSHEVSQALAEF